MITAGPYNWCVCVCVCVCVCARASLCVCVCLSDLTTEQTFTELVLLILGLKFSLSRLKVILSIPRNLFIPTRRDVAALAIVFTEGSPSSTTTRSARYVAMMKSCSTTNAVFFACKMNLYK